MEAKRLKSSIKTKILLGFGSAILILLTAGIISYESINDLMRSVDILSKPDVKLAKLNDVLSDLSFSENHIRSYFISREKKYLDRYKYYSEKIEKNIDTLSLLTNDYKNDSNNIKRISVLWLEKRNHTQNLIELYQKKAENKLPEKLFKTFNSPNPDIPTVIITKIITIKTIIKNQKEEAKRTEETKPEEKQSFWGKFFKRKEKEETRSDTSISPKPLVIKETKTTIDTVYTKGEINEANDNEGSFARIITEIKDQNTKSRKELSNNETEIIQKDIALIKYIRSIVVDLRNEEQNITEKNVKDAKKILETSLVKILLFGISGISAILVFVFMIMNDVTKSNYQKHQLLNDRIQAEELARTKEIFLATMSHEIRTPLNSIIGFTEQLSQTTLQNKQKYFLQAVSSSTSHLLSLVNDILDLSRIEAGKIDFEEICFHLKTVIEEVNDAFYLKASEKNILLSYSLSGNDSLLIGDPFRLKQILLNLVSNAVKFTEKGSIHISCEELEETGEEAKVIISVKDTGIGIPRHKMENIFEVFRQADSSITRKYGGTGLGLSISKKITESQGGKIYVTSEKGKGSEFKIEIVYKKSKETPPSSFQKKPLDLKNLYGIRILVVEDDEFNLLLFHTVFTKWNMKVRITSNGEEALQLLEQEIFDVLITDIHMPGISGIDLLETIKSHSQKSISSTPVLAITANVIKEPLEIYKDAGFEEILFKPFKEDDLARAIIKACSIEDESKNKTTGLLKNDYAQKKNSFSDFINFSGGDMAAVQIIIEAFITNYYEQLEKINRFYKNKDWGNLKETAHRLAPGFGHLQNHEMVAILHLLETYLQKERSPDNIKLKRIIADISFIGAKQIKELETERMKIC